MLEKLADLLHSIHLPDLVSPDTLARLLKIIFIDLWRSVAEIALFVAGIAHIRFTKSVGGAVDIIARPKRGVGNMASKGAGLAGAIAGVVSIAKLITIAKQEQETEKAEPLPTRSLGKMGFNATILGMGGVYICNGTQVQGLSILNRALEKGITYYDTASQYGNGESERRYGLWLQQLEAEGRRGEVFVATKTLSRGYDVASEEIAQSLARLKTSYLDLLQVHAINDLDTWNMVKGRNGSLRAVEAAKASGRVKHIGITGHKDPAVLMQALDEYPFDSVLMPLGITDRMHVPFVRDLLPVCAEKGISIVAMKVFSEGNLVAAGADLPRCLHYTLSLPLSTAIVGMASPEQVDLNVAWTKTFVGMTEEEKEALAEEVRRLMNVDDEWWKK
jgi:hypothetical protein